MDRVAGNAVTSFPGPLVELEEGLRDEDSRPGTLERLRNDPLLQAALVDTYGLPKERDRPGLDLSSAVLLSATEIGFVLEAPSYPEHLWGPTQALVVKFLYPSQLDEPAAVSSLHEEATATRVAQPDRYLFSAPGALAMVKMPGIPLVDWLERQPWWRPESASRATAYTSERVEAMRTVGTSLCRSLRTMGSVLQGGHGNLELSNVLIAEEAGSLVVNLIDLTADVGSADGPENGDAGLRNDGRGVGVAMLQVATPYRIDSRTGGDGEAVQRALAGLWGDAPGFARIVEDLVDRAPERRMAMLTEEPLGTDSWTSLEERIQDEYEIQRMFRPPIDSLDGTDANVTTWAQVRHYFRATRHLEAEWDAGWGSLALLRWLNVLAYAFWVLSLTGFVLLTSADLGLNAPSGATAAFIEHHAHFTVGEFADNFPGRLIAISFAYVALAFYMRILSGVTVRRLGIPWIELAFRSAPVLLNAPIILVIYFDPKLWAAAATLGMVTAVTICIAMRELDRRALGAMDARFHYSPMALREAHEARIPHESWARTLSVYLIVVLLPLDLGLYSADLGLSGHSILRDGGFYAVLLALGCNFYSIYWNSIRKLERNTRGSLQQSSFILRRASRLDPGSAAPSVFAGSQIRGGTLAYIPALPVLVGTVYLASLRDPAVTNLALVGAGLICSAAALTMVASRRLRDRIAKSVAVKAALATAVAFAVFAFLAVLAVATDGGGALLGLFLVACVATTVGDQMFKRTLSELRDLLPTRRRKDAVEPHSFAWTEPFAEAEASLEQGRDPREVSVRLGHGLIGTGLGSSRDKVESRLIAAWETNPYLGRLAQRLLMASPRGKMVCGSIPELRKVHQDLERQEAPRQGVRRLFARSSRAEICMAEPGEELRPRVARTLQVVGGCSVAIGVICTLGWLYYATTDLDWTRTAGRTLALSYSLAAVYYHRMLVGWITVAGMRRKPTEIALRTVPFVFQGPAITAIFLWPNLWPLEATIGVGATAVINYLLLRVIRDAAHSLRTAGGWSLAEVEKLTATNFASWWTTAAIYLSGVVLFDLLLTATSVLHDDALYALVLAAGANIYLIVYSSLRKHGPEVSGQVARAVVLLRVLKPLPKRVPLSVEAPRKLLIAQAILTGLSASCLVLVDHDSAVLWIAVPLSVMAAALAFAGSALMQSMEATSRSPRAEALSRLMASLSCWGTGAALFALALPLQLQLAALLSFLGALTVAFWLGTPPPPTGRGAGSR